MRTATPRCHDCSVPSCGRPVRCKGFCKVHYERSRRGIPLDAPIAPKMRTGTPAERLSSRLIRAENGCLEFAGATSDGYGRISIEGTVHFTHRLTWELANGPIPVGLFVLHACDNRRCCNVEHLFLGTAADNTADMLAKGRHAAQKATACVNGHPLTPENIRLSSYGGYVVRRCRACAGEAKRRSRTR